MHVYWGSLDFPRRLFKMCNSDVNKIYYGCDVGKRESDTF